MPSLGSYDALRQVQATIEEINAARDAAESLVPTSRGILQFDPRSKQRLEIAASQLFAGETVQWKMADNSKVTLDKQELLNLIQEASGALVVRMRRTFEYSNELKARMERGDVVTLRDISLERW